MLNYNKFLSDKAIIIEEETKNYFILRQKRSSKLINIPNKMTPDFAYLLGYITGDGSIHKPLKRKKGGYHWKITISCSIERVNLLLDIITKIFDFEARVYRDNRKNDSYEITIYSKIIHKYLTDEIGFKAGKKSGNIQKLNYVYSNKLLFKHYLAGLIESDGYICDKYLAIIQKDRKFLEIIRKHSKEFLNYDFSETKVNRRINNEPVGWWIYSRKVKVFKEIVPLRY